MGNFSMIITVAIFFNFLQLAFLIASKQPPYVPTDDITLNCGASSGTNGSDGRFWAGEKGSKFGPFESSRNSSSAYTANKQGLAETVPYMTARVSSSEFKYAFPGSPGQKFVRLHFHPATYGKFDRSKAFFSVKAGSFTLLRNFSALLVAESLEVETFVREFCLNVEENQVLDLIFTPTPSASNDTYVFINGIEIVSMPPTPPEDLVGAKFIFFGKTSGFWVNNYTALETVYRLNVGGNSISPTKDSGLFRSWVDDFSYTRDDSYVTANNTVAINYRFPRYIAPEEVYLTARTMGPNFTYNKLHNLSWGLPVDSGFMYLVRLHFCEMHDLIDSPGERQFEIFINNQTAEPLFDVIMWSEHSQVPVYKDYVLWIFKKGQDNKQDLSIALHPIAAKYFDVILNGIEVFKLNYSDGNIAGPNPEVYSPVSPPAESSNSTDGKSKEAQINAYHWW